MDDQLRRSRIVLGAILAASTGLRFWQAASGGQFWWEDERRFLVSQAAASKLLIGHVPGALRALFGAADHIGFKVIGVPIAFAVNAGAPIGWAAAYFSLFSVASIWLVWRIAKDLTGGDDAAAVWSAAFAAASITLFYYARQLFPYDPALALALLAFAAAVRDRPLLAGLSGGAAFVTYSGYWLFIGIVIFAGVFFQRASLVRRLRQCGFAGFGLTLPIVTTLLIGRALGIDLIRAYLAFSRTVILGDFDLGWTFTPRYFLHAEGVLCGLWFAAFVAAAAGCFARRRRTLWILGAATAAIYLGLAVCSSVLHQFVIYGRTARCLTPLFCLMAGIAAAECCRVSLRPRLTAGALALLLAAVSAPHFVTVLSQWYPDRFTAQAQALVARQPHPERLRIVNDWYYNGPDWIYARPVARTLFSRPHPWQYEPYLYENQTDGLRAAYHALGGAMPMRLVELAKLGTPGPIHLQLMLPSTRGGKPLVTAGHYGQADCAYVILDAPGRFRFGFRHADDPPDESGPVDLDPAVLHDVAVSLGSAQPGRVIIEADAKIVLDRPASLFPAGTEDIDAGMNLFGSRAAEPLYRDEIRSITPGPL